MLLAVDSAFVLWLTPAALVISVAANAAQVLLSRSVGKREITFAASPVEKVEFNRFVEETRGERDKIHLRIDNLPMFKLAELSTKVASLESASTLVSQRLYQVDEKLDRLIDKLIPLPREK